MKIKSIIKPKKVALSDVASPKPSRAATRAISGAIKRAYLDQKTVSQEAHSLRSN
ncbi:MAG: hypothetical protein WDN66_02980 [Candidatus Saccharibacteria bacterium]